MKADRCAQYIDDIGVAAHTASELIENIDRVFGRIQKAGLKMSIENCHFGEHSIEFLGNTLCTALIAPTEERITKFLVNLKLASSVKTLQRYLGFVSFYRQYLPGFAGKIVSLHSLLRKKRSFQINTPT